MWGGLLRVAFGPSLLLKSSWVQLLLLALVTCGCFPLLQFFLFPYIFPVLFFPFFFLSHFPLLLTPAPPIYSILSFPSFSPYFSSFSAADAEWY